MKQILLTLVLLGATSRCGGGRPLPNDSGPMVTPVKGAGGTGGSQPVGTLAGGSGGSAGVGGSTGTGGGGRGGIDRHRRCGGRGRLDGRRRWGGRGRCEARRRGRDRRPGVRRRARRR